MLSNRCASALAVAAVWGGVTLSAGAAVTLVSTEAMLVEGQELLPGLSVAEIDGPSVNSVGGYVVRVNLGQIGNNGTSVIFGAATRTDGSVLVTEGEPASYSPQTGFESAAGISDSGVVGYSATATGPTRDAVFTTDGFGAVRGQPIPAGSSLSPQYNFGSLQLRPRMSSSGTLFWTGDYREPSASSDAGRAIFRGTDADVLLKSGDAIGGISDLVGGASFQFNGFDISATGNTYITRVTTDDINPDTADVLVINGNAVTVSGTVLREGNAVVGSPGLTYTSSSFTTVAANDAGDFITAGTVGTGSGSDFAAFLNGEVLWIEGQSIDGRTLTASAGPTVDINEAGDWAMAILDTGASVATLIVNGEVVLEFGDAIDTTGDAVADAPLSFMQSVSGIAIGERQAGGLVDVYAIVQASGINSEILLRTTVLIPEPTTGLLLLLGGLPLVWRRHHR